jgi:hypothetical protein
MIGSWPALMAYAPSFFLAGVIRIRNLLSCFRAAKAAPRTSGR